MLRFAVELARRGQVAAEGLFENHPPPDGAVLLRQPGRAELLDDRRKELRRGGQVVEVVPLGAMRFVHLVQQFFEALVGLGIVDIAGQIVEAFGEPVPKLLVDRGGGELAQLGAHLLAELVVSHCAAREADDGEMLGKQAVAGEIVERGEQFALGEVSGGAEDDHDARIAGAARGPVPFVLLAGLRCHS